MSKLSQNAVVLGESGTPANNLCIRANLDGTFTLARGNLGATTQDILTIDASGRVAMPQSVIAFSAYPTVAQGMGAGNWVKLLCPTEEFDVGGFFDASISRFQPTVPGIYSFGGGFQAATVISDLRLAVWKNGLERRRIGTSVSSGSLNWTYGAALFYLNGSTDYLELYGYSTAANTTNPFDYSTYVQGNLIGKA